MGFEELYVCKVCGAMPDEFGCVQHGRGCYVVSEDGGGCEFVEMPEAEKALPGQDFSRRPWAADAQRRSAVDGQYAEYEAWRGWFEESVDDHLADAAEDGILDTLSLTQASYLFNVMGRLADGWPTESNAGGRGR